MSKLWILKIGLLSIRITYQEKVPRGFNDLCRKLETRNTWRTRSIKKRKSMVKSISLFLKNEGSIKTEIGIRGPLP